MSAASFTVDPKRVQITSPDVKDDQDRCERCPETSHRRARQDSNLQPLDRLLAFSRSPPDREIPVFAGDFSVSW